MQPELCKWEQELTPLGCGCCGAHSHAAHCFHVSELQDQCDPWLLLGFLSGSEEFKKRHEENKTLFWQCRKIDPKGPLKGNADCVWKAKAQL